MAKKSSTRKSKRSVIRDRFVTVKEAKKRKRTSVGETMRTPKRK